MKNRVRFHLLLFLGAVAMVLLVRWSGGSARRPSTDVPTHRDAPGATGSRAAEVGETPARFSRLN